MLTGGEQPGIPAARRTASEQDRSASQCMKRPVIVARMPCSGIRAIPCHDHPGFHFILSGLDWHKALEAADWRVSGKDGAAERLGLKPSTLEYRIRKLGLTRPA